jgi:hypothetical protein
MSEHTNDDLYRIISELREDQREMRDTMKADNIALWSVVTDLRDTVATGKGAVRALLWVGGVISAIAAFVLAALSYFRPHA